MTVDTDSGGIKSKYQDLLSLPKYLTTCPNIFAHLIDFIGPIKLVLGLSQTQGVSNWPSGLDWWDGENLLPALIHATEIDGHNPEEYYTDTIQGDSSIILATN